MNLFKAELGDLSFQEKILLANMKRTVTMFQNMIGDAPEVEMWDDQHCRTALNELRMKEGHDLVFDFDREVVGHDQVRPLSPRDGVQHWRQGSGGGGGGFFEALLATTPKHAVIRMALMNFVLM